MNTATTILLCTVAFIIAAIQTLIDTAALITRKGADKVLQFENYLIGKINERKAKAAGVLAAA